MNKMFAACVLSTATYLCSCTADNVAVNDTADADYINYTVGFGGYNTYTPYYWNNYSYPAYVYSSWPNRYNYNNYYYRHGNYYSGYKRGYYHRNAGHFGGGRGGRR